MLRPVSCHERGAQERWAQSQAAREESEAREREAQKRIRPEESRLRVREDDDTDDESPRMPKREL